MEPYANGLDGFETHFEELVRCKALLRIIRVAKVVLLGNLKTSCNRGKAQ